MAAPLSEGTPDVFADATTFRAAEPGISRDKSTAVYESWANSGTYEKEMCDDNYGGHKAAAEATADFFPEDRQNKLILDVGSGTGLVGVKLRELGFKRLHGLDPSPSMLDLARHKDIYETDFCCYLDSNPLPMDEGTYDGAVSSGAMCEGHIPTAGLRQLTRVIKPGGLVCLVMREQFLDTVAEYKGRLEQEMTAMEQDGVWRLVAKNTFPRYFHHFSGVVFSFQVSKTEVIPAKQKRDDATQTYLRKQSSGATRPAQRVSAGSRNSNAGYESFQGPQTDAQTSPHQLSDSNGQFASNHSDGQCSLNHRPSTDGQHAPNLPSEWGQGARRHSESEPQFSPGGPPHSYGRDPSSNFDGPRHSLNRRQSSADDVFTAQWLGPAPTHGMPASWVVINPLDPSGARGRPAVGAVDRRGGGFTLAVDRGEGSSRPAVDRMEGDFSPPVDTPTVQGRVAAVKQTDMATPQAGAQLCAWPVQAVPMLTGGPVLIMAQGGRAVGGNQPLVQVLTPQGVTAAKKKEQPVNQVCRTKGGTAPKKEEEPLKQRSRTEGETAGPKDAGGSEGVLQEGGHRLVMTREARVWLADPRAGSPPPTSPHLHTGLACSCSPQLGRELDEEEVSSEEERPPQRWEERPPQRWEERPPQRWEERPPPCREPHERWERPCSRWRAVSEPCRRRPLTLSVRARTPSPQAARRSAGVRETPGWSTEVPIRARTPSPLGSRSAGVREAPGWSPEVTVRARTPSYLGSRWTGEREGPGLSPEVPVRARTPSYLGSRWACEREGPRWSPEVPVRARTSSYLGSRWAGEREGPRWSPEVPVRASSPSSPGVRRLETVRNGPCWSTEVQDGSWSDQGEDEVVEEEEEVEVDGNVGHLTTITESRSEVGGGTRVVRRRQASLWLRDRQDGRPHKVQEVEDHLHTLLTSGIHTSTTTQGGSRPEAKPSKPRERRSRASDRRPKSSRGRKVVGERAPRPKVSCTDSAEDSTSTSTPSDVHSESVVDPKGYSEDDGLYEEVQMAVEKILTLKKRQRGQAAVQHVQDTTISRPHDQASMQTVPSPFSPLGASTPRLRPPTSGGGGPSSTGEPSQAPTPALESREQPSGLLPEMEELHRSMAEMLQSKVNLQNNVDHLLKSKVFLEKDINQLKEEIFSHRQQNCTHRAWVSQNKPDTEPMTSTDLTSSHNDNSSDISKDQPSILEGKGTTHETIIAEQVMGKEISHRVSHPQIGNPPTALPFSQGCCGRPASGTSYYVMISSSQTGDGLSDTQRHTAGLQKDHRQESSCPTGCDYMDTQMHSSHAGHNHTVYSHTGSCQSNKSQIMSYRTLCREPASCQTAGSQTMRCQKGSCTANHQIGSCTANPQIGSYTASHQIGSCTANPQIGSYTASHQIGSCTANPQIGSYTASHQIGSCTANPQIGSCTANHQIGSCTANHQIGSCTANHQIGNCTANHQIGSYTASRQIGSNQTHITTDQSSQTCCSRTVCSKTDNHSNQTGGDETHVTQDQSSQTDRSPAGNHILSCQTGSDERHLTQDPSHQTIRCQTGSPTPRYQSGESEAHTARDGSSQTDQGEAGSSPIGGRGAFTPVTDSGKEKGHRLLFPRPVPRPADCSSFLSVAGKMSASQVTMQRELAVIGGQPFQGLEQLRPASPAISQGFELCYACNSFYMDCQCEYGSENNNSDRRPDVTEVYRQSASYPGAGTTSIRTRTVTEWRGDPDSIPRQQQASSAQSHLYPRSEPGLEHSSDRGRQHCVQVHAQPRGKLQPEEAWKGLTSDQDGQEFPRQPNTFTGETIRRTMMSDSFYEDEVQQTFPPAGTELRGEQPNKEARASPRQETFTPPQTSTRPAEDEVREDGSAGNIDTNEVRQGQSGAVKHHTYYRDEVYDGTQSQKTMPSELLHTQCIYDRGPSATNRRRPNAGLCEESSAEDQRGPGQSADDPVFFSSQGRNSPARQRRRRNMAFLASSAHSANLSRSPTSPVRSPLSQQAAGYGPSTNTITTTTTVSFYRQPDRRPWGSHADTRDTTSPSRLSDRIMSGRRHSTPPRLPQKHPCSWESRHSMTSLTRITESGSTLSQEMWNNVKRRTDVGQAPNEFSQEMRRRFQYQEIQEIRTQPTGIYQNIQSQCNTRRQQSPIPASGFFDFCDRDRGATELETDHQRHTVWRRPMAGNEERDSRTGRDVGQDGKDLEEYSYKGRQFSTPASFEESCAEQYQSLAQQTSAPKDSVVKSVRKDLQAQPPSTSEQSTAPRPGSAAKVSGPSGQHGDKQQRGPFIYPKKHDCGAWRDSFPPDSPFKDKSSEGPQEFSTHFSRWCRPQPKATSRQPRTKKRPCSASPSSSQRKPPKVVVVQQRRCSSVSRTSVERDREEESCRSQQVSAVPGEVVRREDSLRDDDDTWQDSQVQVPFSYHLSTVRRYGNDLVPRPSPRWNGSHRRYDQCGTRSFQGGNDYRCYGDMDHFTQRFYPPQGAVPQLEIRVGIARPLPLLVAMPRAPSPSPSVMDFTVETETLARISVTAVSDDLTQTRHTIEHQSYRENVSKTGLIAAPQPVPRRRVATQQSCVQRIEHDVAPQPWSQPAQQTVIQESCVDRSEIVVAPQPWSQPAQQTVTQESCAERNEIVMSSHPWSQPAQQTVTRQSCAESVVRTEHTAAPQPGPSSPRNVPATECDSLDLGSLSYEEEVYTTLVSRAVDRPQLTQDSLVFQLIAHSTQTEVTEPTLYGTKHEQDIQVGPFTKSTLEPSRRNEQNRMIERETLVRETTVEHPAVVAAGKIESGGPESTQENWYTKPEQQLIETRNKITGTDDDESAMTKQTFHKETQYTAEWWLFNQDRRNHSAHEHQVMQQCTSIQDTLNMKDSHVIKETKKIDRSTLIEEDTAGSMRLTIAHTCESAVCDQRSLAFTNGRKTEKVASDSALNFKIQTLPEGSVSGKLPESTVFSSQNTQSAPGFVVPRSGSVGTNNAMPETGNRFCTPLQSRDQSTSALPGTGGTPISAVSGTGMAETSAVPQSVIVPSTITPESEHISTFTEPQSVTQNTAAPLQAGTMQTYGLPQDPDTNMDNENLTARAVPQTVAHNTNALPHAQPLPVPPRPQCTTQQSQLISETTTAPASAVPQSVGESQDAAEIDRNAIPVTAQSGQQHSRQIHGSETMPRHSAHYSPIAQGTENIVPQSGTQHSNPTPEIEVVQTYVVPHTGTTHESGNVPQYAGRWSFAAQGTENELVHIAPQTRTHHPDPTPQSGVVQRSVVPHAGVLCSTSASKSRVNQKSTVALPEQEDTVTTPGTGAIQTSRVAMPRPGTPSFSAMSEIGLFQSSNTGSMCSVPASESRVNHKSTVALPEQEDTLTTPGTGAIQTSAVALPRPGLSFSAMSEIGLFQSSDTGSMRSIPASESMVNQKSAVALPGQEDTLTTPVAGAIQMSQQNTLSTPVAGAMQACQQDTLTTPRTGVIQTPQQDTLTTPGTGAIQTSATALPRPGTPSFSAMSEIGLFQSSHTLCSTSSSESTANQNSAVALPVQEDAVTTQGTGAIQMSQEDIVTTPGTGSIQMSQQDSLTTPGAGAIQTTQQGAVSSPGSGAIQTSQQGAVTSPGTGAIQKSEWDTVTTPRPGSIQTPQQDTLTTPGTGAIQTSAVALPRPGTPSFSAMSEIGLFQSSHTLCSTSSSESTANQNSAVALPVQEDAVTTQGTGAIQMSQEDIVTTPGVGSIQMSQQGTLTTPGTGAIQTSQQDTLTTPGSGAIQTPQQDTLTSPGTGAIQICQQDTLATPGAGAIQMSQQDTLTTPGVGSIQTPQQDTLTTPGTGAIQTSAVALPRPGTPSFSAMSEIGLFQSSLVEQSDSQHSHETVKCEVIRSSIAPQHGTQFSTETPKSKVIHSSVVPQTEITCSTARSPTLATQSSVAPQPETPEAELIQTCGVSPSPVQYHSATLQCRVCQCCVVTRPQCSSATPHHRLISNSAVQQSEHSRVQYSGQIMETRSTDSAVLQYGTQAKRSTETTQNFVVPSFGQQYSATTPNTTQVSGSAMPSNVNQYQASPLTSGMRQCHSEPSPEPQTSLKVKPGSGNAAELSSPEGSSVCSRCLSLELKRIIASAWSSEDCLACRQARTPTQVVAGHSAWRDKGDAQPSWAADTVAVAADGREQVSTDSVPQHIAHCVEAVPHHITHCVEAAPQHIAHSVEAAPQHITNSVEEGKWNRDGNGLPVGFLSQNSHPTCVEGQITPQEDFPAPQRSSVPVKSYSDSQPTPPTPGTRVKVGRSRSLPSARHAAQGAEPSQASEKEAGSTSSAEDRKTARYETVPQVEKRKNKRRKRKTKPQDSPGHPGQQKMLADTGRSTDFETGASTTTNTTDMAPAPGSDSRVVPTAPPGAEMRDRQGEGPIAATAQTTAGQALTIVPALQDTDVSQKPPVVLPPASGEQTALTGVSRPQTVKNILHHNPVSRQKFSPTTSLTVSNHVYLTPHHPQDLVYLTNKQIHSKDAQDAGCQCFSQSCCGHCCSGEAEKRDTCGKRRVRKGVPKGKPHSECNDIEVETQAGTCPDEAKGQYDALNFSGSAYCAPQTSSSNFDHDRCSCLTMGHACPRAKNTSTCNKNSEADEDSVLPRQTGSEEGRSLPEHVSCPHARSTGTCSRNPEAVEDPVRPRKRKPEIGRSLPEDFSCNNKPDGQDTPEETASGGYLQSYPADSESTGLYDVLQNFSKSDSNDGRDVESFHFSVDSVDSESTLPFIESGTFIPEDARKPPSPSGEESRNVSMQGDSKETRRPSRQPDVSADQESSQAPCHLARDTEQASQSQGVVSTSDNAHDRQLQSTRAQPSSSEHPGCHYHHQCRALRKKLHDLKSQYKQMVQQAQTQCVKLVDQEVKVKDAQLLEERMTKARLKEAIVVLQKQLRDAEKETWRTALDGQSAQQAVVCDKMVLNQQLDAVQKEAASLRAEKDDLTVKLDKTRDTEKTLEKQLSEARCSQREQEAVSRERSAEVSSYRALLDVCHLQYQREQENASKLREQLDQVTKRLEERNQESDTLRLQLTNAKMVIIKRRQQLEQLKLMQTKLKKDCQKEQTMSAVEVRERNVVEDLETDRYHVLLNQVKEQSKQLMNFSAKMETLDPTRLKQQYEVRYRSQVDWALRHISDILEQRASVAEQMELKQQQATFEQRAHEANVHILRQRNRQLRAMRTALAEEHQLVADLGLTHSHDPQHHRSADVFTATPQHHHSADVFTATPQHHHSADVFTATPQHHHSADVIMATPQHHHSPDVFTATPQHHHSADVFMATPQHHHSPDVFMATPQHHRSADVFTATPQHHRSADVFTVTPQHHHSADVFTATPQHHHSADVFTATPAGPKPTDVCDNNGTCLAADGGVNGHVHVHGARTHVPGVNPPVLNGHTCVGGVHSQVLGDYPHVPSPPQGRPPPSPLRPRLASPQQQRPTPHGHYTHKDLLDIRLRALNMMSDTRHARTYTQPGPLASCPSRQVWAVKSESRSFLASIRVLERVSGNSADPAPGQTVWPVSTGQSGHASTCHTWPGSAYCGDGGGHDTTHPSTMPHSCRGRDEAVVQLRCNMNGGGGGGGGRCGSPAQPLDRVTAADVCGAHSALQERCCARFHTAPGQTCREGASVNGEEEENRGTQLGEGETLSNASYSQARSIHRLSFSVLNGYSTQPDPNRQLQRIKTSEENSRKEEVAPERASFIHQPDCPVSGTRCCKENFHIFSSSETKVETLPEGNGTREVDPDQNSSCILTEPATKSGDSINADTPEPEHCSGENTPACGSGHRQSDLPDSRGSSAGHNQGSSSLSRGGQGNRCNDLPCHRDIAGCADHITALQTDGPGCSEVNHNWAMGQGRRDSHDSTMSRCGENCPGRHREKTTCVAPYTGCVSISCLQERQAGLRSAHRVHVWKGKGKLYPEDSEGTIGSAQQVNCQSKLHSGPQWASSVNYMDAFDERKESVVFEKRQRMTSHRFDVTRDLQHSCACKDRLGFFSNQDRTASTSDTGRKVQHASRNNNVKMSDRGMVSQRSVHSSTRSSASALVSCMASVGTTFNSPQRAAGEERSVEVKATTGSQTGYQPWFSERSNTVAVQTCEDCMVGGLQSVFTQCPARDSISSQQRYITGVSCAQSLHDSSSGSGGTRNQKRPFSSKVGTRHLPENCSQFTSFGVGTQTHSSTLCAYQASEMNETELPPCQTRICTKQSDNQRRTDSVTSGDELAAPSSQTERMVGTQTSPFLFELIQDSGGCDPDLMMVTVKRHTAVTQTSPPTPGTSQTSRSASSKSPQEDGKNDRCCTISHKAATILSSTKPSTSIAIEQLIRQTCHDELNRIMHGSKRTSDSDLGAGHWWHSPALSPRQAVEAADFSERSPSSEDGSVDSLQALSCKQEVTTQTSSCTASVNFKSQRRRMSAGCGASFRTSADEPKPKRDVSQQQQRKPRAKLPQKDTCPEQMTSQVMKEGSPGPPCQGHVPFKKTETRPGAQYSSRVSVSTISTFSLSSGHVCPGPETATKDPSVSRQPQQTTASTTDTRPCVVDTRVEKFRDGGLLDILDSIEQRVQQISVQASTNLQWLQGQGHSSPYSGSAGPAQATGGQSTQASSRELLVQELRSSLDTEASEVLSSSGVVASSEIHASDIVQSSDFLPLSDTTPLLEDVPSLDMLMVSKVVSHKDATSSSVTVSSAVTHTTSRLPLTCSTQPGIDTAPVSTSGASPTAPRLHAPLASIVQPATGPGESSVSAPVASPDEYCIPHPAGDVCATANLDVTEVVGLEPSPRTSSPAVCPPSGTQAGLILQSTCGVLAKLPISGVFLTSGPPLSVEQYTLTTASSADRTPPCHQSCQAVVPSPSSQQLALQRTCVQDTSTVSSACGQQTLTRAHCTLSSLVAQPPSGCQPMSAEQYSPTVPSPSSLKPTCGVQPESREHYAPTAPSSSGLQRTCGLQPVSDAVCTPTVPSLSGPLWAAGSVSALQLLSPVQPTSCPQQVPGMQTSSCPQQVSQIQPLSCPQQMSQIQQSSCPQQMSRIQPSSCPQQMSQIQPSSCPQQMSRIQLSSCPQQMSRIQPSSCPQQMSQIQPSSCPQQMSQIQPSSCPQQMSRIQPSSCPQQMSRIQPSSCPQQMSQIQPSSCPHQMSQIQPSSCPQQMSRIQPSSCPQQMSRIQPSSCPQQVSQIQPSSCPQKASMLQPSSSPEQMSRMQSSSCSQQVSRIQPPSGPLQVSRIQFKHCPQPSPCPQPVSVQPSPCPLLESVQPSPCPQPVSVQPSPCPQPVSVQPSPCPQPVSVQPSPYPQPVSVQRSPCPQLVSAQPSPCPQSVSVQPSPCPQPVSVQPSPYPKPVSVQPFLCPQPVSDEPTICPQPVCSLEPVSSEQFTPTALAFCCPLPESELSLQYASSTVAVETHSGLCDASATASVCTIEPPTGSTVQASCQTKVKSHHVGHQSESCASVAVSRTPAVPSDPPPVTPTVAVPSCPSPPAAVTLAPALPSSSLLPAAVTAPCLPCTSASAATRTAFIQHMSASQAMNPTAFSPASAPPTMEPTATVSLTPSPALCLDTGRITPPPSVCLDTGRITPPPAVCLDTGRIIPPPAICLDTGRITPPPSICLDIGRITPPPAVCLDIGRITPPPAVCLDTGRITPPPAVCLDTGRITPPPAVCLDIGRITPPPAVCLDTGRMTPPPNMGRMTPPPNMGRMTPPPNMGRMTPPNMGRMTPPPAVWPDIFRTNPPPAVCLDVGCITPPPCFMDTETRSGRGTPRASPAASPPVIHAVSLCSSPRCAGMSGASPVCTVAAPLTPAAFSQHVFPPEPPLAPAHCGGPVPYRSLSPVAFSHSSPTVCRSLSVCVSPAPLTVDPCCYEYSLSPRCCGQQMGVVTSFCPASTSTTIGHQTCTPGPSHKKGKSKGPATKKTPAASMSAGFSKKHKRCGMKSGQTEASTETSTGEDIMQNNTSQTDDEGQAPEGDGAVSSWIPAFLQSLSPPATSRLTSSSQHGRGVGASSASDADNEATDSCGDPFIM